MNKKELAKYEMEKKSGAAGFILSCLITGAGSMYAGKTGKGVILFCLMLFMWLFMMGWIVWIVAPFIALMDVGTYNDNLKDSITG